MAVIIEPDEGNVAEIGRQLLGLADHYTEVRWVTWPTAGYLVSEDLAVKLKAVRADADKADGSDDKAPKETPRRRGRPRRQEEQPVQDTDDNDKEE